MVRDNQTAKIQVGEQVPIATTQQQGTSTTDRVINQIEYKDTGVMLSVKPRVTPGGLVQMEIEQEVSTVAVGKRHPQLTDFPHPQHHQQRRRSL